MSTTKSFSWKFYEKLYFITRNKSVLSRYHNDSVKEVTLKKHRKILNTFIENIDNSNYTVANCCKFTRDNLYIEDTLIYIDNNKREEIIISRLFENIIDFATYRNNDFSNCNLSLDIKNLEYYKNNEYSINEKTVLPFDYDSNIECYTKKMYIGDSNVSYIRNVFRVEKVFVDINGKEIKHYDNFSTFADFAFYLDNDLSGADLLECDGIENIVQYKELILDNVLAKNSAYDLLGVEYENVSFGEDLLKTLDFTSQNEKCYLEKTKEIQLVSQRISILERIKEVSYVSDMHLLHRLKNANCKTHIEIQRELKSIAETIYDNSSNTLLINGDLSSDFEIYKEFIYILADLVKKGNSRSSLFHKTIIFTLGNHELWGFQNESVIEIVEKYRTVIENNGMIFLHNDLLLKNIDGSFEKISEKEIQSDDLSSLKERMKETYYVIFGGLGFAGNNDIHNANAGLYNGTIDRREEIEESSRIDNLYGRILPVLKGKNVLIMTHNPFDDWCTNPIYEKGFVYFYGHTHMNHFFDDGETRIIADNQIGYYNDNVIIKHFYMEEEFDYFFDYVNGIYQITAKEYKIFCAGKHLGVTFNSNDNVFMLKKNGFYCFITESKSGNLCILNGGNKKRLAKKSVDYYYNNMDEMIARIESPFNEYTKLQEKISLVIKKLGGRGYIHGCIIDIDFENHVYLNPQNNILTPYYASNIIDKLIYPSVSSLLKERCPELYSNYIKLLDSYENKALILFENKNNVFDAPKEYKDTDIYRVSNEFKKMQKLSSNILSFWYEDEPKTEPNKRRTEIKKKESVVEPKELPQELESKRSIPKTIPRIDASIVE